MDAPKSQFTTDENELTAEVLHRLEVAFGPITEDQLKAFVGALVLMGHRKRLRVLGALLIITASGSQQSPTRSSAPSALSKATSVCIHGLILGRCPLCR
jgi:hypothetical protein